MNILFITEKDAANISLSRITAAFLDKNAQIKIYAPYYNKSVLKYFDEKIPKFNIKDLTIADIEWCDIIFCSTLSSVYLPEFVFSARRPIFTHNYLLNRQINWGGDICFAPSKATVSSDYDEYMNYSYIGIGEPKYDKLLPEDVESDKRFLFIDSGHYPFSYEGKKELAKTLVYICKKYPDYELMIKPRFLPGDSIITHRNNIHLYKMIEEETNNNIPQNMKLLTEHKDLQELINKSTTVICMYTTSFVGAVVSGKGLIVLENLKSQDVYDIRHKTYMRNRENMILSGALVDYRDIDRLLPWGAKASEQYLNFLLEEKGNVANKIVETCIYLWSEYYSQGLFPKNCDTTYKKFKTDYIIDSGMTWEKYIAKRYHDYMLLKSMILIDFNVNAKIDISFVINRINDLENENTDGIISEKIFKEFMKNANEIRDKCIVANRSEMLKNDIDSGVLLNSYYLLKMYNEIITFPKKSISAYNLFRAFAEFDSLHCDLNIAKNNLIIYFDKTLDRKYNIEISDMPNNRFRAFNLLIDIFMKENDIENVIKYNEYLKIYYQMCYFDGDSNDEIQIQRRNQIKENELWIKKIQPL